MSLSPCALGLTLLLCARMATIAAQAAPRPPAYCIRAVALDRAGERRGSLVLQDGVITAILDEAAPAPPGTRVIEGAGWICLPAFLDAYSRQGCVVPQPVKDRDVPPDTHADVEIDMRQANRKGIQPSFRAVETLVLTKEESEAWRKNGFGAVLVAPGGELIAGSSALATVREAAIRDRVLRDTVFEHGTFAASGEGYPSTLMGYFAQLRQFFLDSKRQVELTDRYGSGRPGPRPPYDAELSVGAELVSGHRLLVAEANDANDIERWWRLADEFGVRVGIAGGLEAWRLRPALGERETPLVLTLDWGKEPEGPKAKASSSPGSAERGEGAEEKKDAVEPIVPEDPGREYREPLAVRLERRAKWERDRDCAKSLHEAGIRFAFGTGLSKPGELLQHVRDLVTAGLPADAAMRALTVDAARILGVDGRIGTIAPGYDATFSLWRSDPLLDEKASVAWSFVDGYPREYPPEKRKAKGPSVGPAEGVDVTGTWELEFRIESQGIKSATLVLEMEKGGELGGTIEVDNPHGGERLHAAVEGTLGGMELELAFQLAFGGMTIETSLQATVDGDRMSGKGSFDGSLGDRPQTQPFEGKRIPE